MISQLGDHVEMLFGFAFKSKAYTENPDDIRLLRGDNIAQGVLRWDGVKRWPAHDHEAFARYDLSVDDVVLAMDRPWIDAGLKYARIRDSDLPALLVQRVARLRAKNSLDQTFLFYLIGSRAFTDHVKAITTGANVPHIAGRDIAAFRFTLPPLETQRRIAKILSAYDDLIEVNQRRIAILEEMARRLFEEWFVRFRYPGHEGDALVEGPLGPTPAAWTIEKASDLFDYCGGGTPSKSEPTYWDGGTINWFTPTDLTKGGALFLDASSLQITELGLAKSSARLFPAGSVMMTSRATLGVFAVAGTPATTNQGFITFKPTARTPTFYLLHCLKREFSRMEAVASGTTFKEVTKGALGDLKFCAPPLGLVQNFECRVSPMLNAVRTFAQQNARLRAARDLLLPKLISAEIEVSAAPTPDDVAKDAA